MPKPGLIRCAYIAACETVHDRTAELEATFWTHNATARCLLSRVCFSGRRLAMGQPHAVHLSGAQECAGDRQLFIALSDIFVDSIMIASYRACWNFFLCSYFLLRCIPESVLFSHEASLTRAAQIGLPSFVSSSRLQIQRIPTSIG